MTSGYHTIVIGAGSGGLTVAVGLARFGKRVALVERGRIGGDCTNVGCIPSKTLIELAQAHALGAPNAPRNPADVLAAVRARRDHLWREEEAEFRRMDGLDVIDGWGRLVGERRVEVTSPDGEPRRLAARHVVLATGSRPAQLEIEGLPAALHHTNESIFELQDAPRHLAIVGSGPTGCELAFAFRNLDTRVTVIEAADRLLPDAEPAASELLRERCRDEGMELWLRARATGWVGSPSDDAEHATPGALVVAQDHAEHHVDGVDAVLISVGRVPNVDDLGLGTVGLEPGPDGIATDDLGRTGVASVYAVGDATAASATTHAANARARRLVQKLAVPWLPVGSERAWPIAVFSDPEIAWVGPTRGELARRMSVEMIRTIRIDLADTDRGYVMGLERGFLQVHAMRLTGRVLSATIAGPAASEMLPLLTHAVDRGLRLYGLANQVYAYPTLMEALKKAADEFQFSTLDELPSELWTYVQHRYRRPRSDRDEDLGGSS